MKKAQDKMSLKINRLQNENITLKKSKPVSRVPFNMSTTNIQEPKASIPKRNPSKLAVFQPTKAKEAPSTPVESEYQYERIKSSISKYEELSIFSSQIQSYIKAAEAMTEANKPSHAISRQSSQQRLDTTQSVTPARPSKPDFQSKMSDFIQQKLASRLSVSRS